MPARIFGIFISVAVLFSGCATGFQQEAVAPVHIQDEDGWITLFNGKDLAGWKLVHRHGYNSWSVQDGVMANSKPPEDAPVDRGTDLMSIYSFGSCELHIEFMVPEGSNSGVFLKGQYEVQVYDSYGKPPSPQGCGAIYGKVAPLINAANPAGEWQSFDVIFYKPRVDKRGKVIKPARMTVYHNGIKVHENVAVSEPTGGPFVHRKVTSTGPLVLQGDHGTVYYRNIRIRPLD